MFESGRNYLIDKNMIKGKPTHRCRGKKGKTIPCLVFNLSGRCVAKKKVNGKKVVLSHMSDWKGHGDLGRNICQKDKGKGKNKKTKKKKTKKKKPKKKKTKKKKPKKKKPKKKKKSKYKKKKKH